MFPNIRIYSLWENFWVDVVISSGLMLCVGLSSEFCDWNASIYSKDNLSHWPFVSSPCFIFLLEFSSPGLSLMLNPLQTAAQVTRDTLAAHGLQADVVVTDLVHGLEKRLAGSVDVLLFNPPYVPTPEYEVHIATPNPMSLLPVPWWIWAHGFFWQLQQIWGCILLDAYAHIWWLWFQVGAAGITATWAGGERGRVVIDRMLTMVDNLLSSKGWFYMVTLTANNPSEICQIMKKKGFASRIIIQVCHQLLELHLALWHALAWLTFGFDLFHLPNRPDSLSSCWWLSAHLHLYKKFGLGWKIEHTFIIICPVPGNSMWRV